MEKMKKYCIYRSFGDVDKQIRKHELIGVAFGMDVEEAYEEIKECVLDDLNGDENIKYHFNADTFDIEENGAFHSNKTYDYVITGIIYPDDGPKNIVRDYGIKEMDYVEF